MCDEVKARAPFPGVTVYGPQGCGKTKDAELIRRHLGRSRVLDSDNGWGGQWRPGAPLPDDTVVLTEADSRPGSRSYADVMSEISPASSAMGRATPGA